MKEPKRLSLANIPTPLQEVEFNGTKLLIKRDDYTGTELTGNKIRKLEYLLYQAKKDKCDYLFTCGGDQSNHARATAIAGAAQGIKSKLFLWGQKKKVSEGNLFLDEVLGAEIEYFKKKDYLDVKNAMKAEAERMLKEGKRAMIIPTGGSNELGMWGYIKFVEELAKQTDLSKIKGIVLANGSGGTAAGIMAGLSLNGIKAKVFGVNVFDKAKEAGETIRELFEACSDKYELNISFDSSLLELLDDYSTEGYKNITPDKLEVIKSFARQTGIFLDPTYTGKAFFAYNDLFLKEKKNKGILFLHTGGIYGIFSKRKAYLNA